MGAISLGYGPNGKRIRRKVSGKIKQEVRAKLQALHQELNAGVRSSSTYALREAVDDWFAKGWMARPRGHAPSSCANDPRSAPRASRRRRRTARSRTRCITPGRCVLCPYRGE